MRPKLGQIKLKMKAGCSRTRSWIFPMTTEIPAGRPGQGPAKAGSRIFVAHKNPALTGAGRWDTLPMGENSEEAIDYRAGRRLG
ncbi:hypothetical protein D7X94_09715 [Acutalibacter sp. 1XD8-33]|nr:hypothetical protein D7X94_09715 [Acutalibacter sp. 1XD8-33]